MTEVKRHVEIAGYGVCLPKQTVQFKNQTRYRVVEDEETEETKETEETAEDFTEE